MQPAQSRRHKADSLGRPHCFRECRVTSTARVGVRARVVGAGSPADWMMLPQGATREMVCNSELEKEAWRSIASPYATAR